MNYAYFWSFSILMNFHWENYKIVLKWTKKLLSCHTQLPSIMVYQNAEYTKSKFLILNGVCALLNIILMMILRKPVAAALSLLIYLRWRREDEMSRIAHNAPVITLFTMHDVQYVGSYVDHMILLLISHTDKDKLLEVEDSVLRYN